MAVTRTPEPRVQTVPDVMPSAVPAAAITEPERAAAPQPGGSPRAAKRRPARAGSRAPAEVSARGSSPAQSGAAAEPPQNRPLFSLPPR
jgi:hypothetical protein